MKHPAMTRVLAIVLVLLCMAMAVAGGLGLSRADRDRNRTQEETARLRSRAEEYRAVALSLEGTESYQTQNETLNEHQTQHAQDSAEHRVDLTTYTTTQYGLRVGTQAIEAAEREFLDYKFIFEHSISDYEKAMEQVSSLLGQLWTLYNTTAAALERANTHLNNAQSMVARLEAGDTLTAAMLVTAYDEAMQALDEVAGLRDTMREMEPTLDAIAAFDPESLTNLTASMDQIPQNIDALSDFKLDPEVEAAFDAPPIDIEELLEIKRVYNQPWASLKQALDTVDTIAPLLEQRAQELTGMDVEQLRAAAQAARDALAAQGDEPLDEETEAAVRLAYALYRDQIQGFLNEAASSLGEVNAYAEQAHTLLTTVQGAVDGMNGLMAKARKMLADAESAIYAAKVTIWWQMGQQTELEEHLREGREKLDEQADTLQTLADQAEEQKALEQRLRSLRAMLLDYDGVRERVEDGQMPDEAALAAAEESEGTAERTWSDRRHACILMLVGAVCALIGIPAAFEQIRSRFLLLVPVILCLGCALGAEWIFVNMGRGHSYSALSVAGFAVLQLLFSAPVKRKTQRRGKHLAA